MHAKADPPPILVDAMLGRLAKWLRLAGYDAAYWRDGSDEALIDRAQAEGRLIVTRDRQLAGRRGVRALFIAAETLDAQIAEVRAALGGDPQPFTRCPECNGALADLARKQRVIWCRRTSGTRRRSFVAVRAAVGYTGRVHIGRRCRRGWRRSDG